jgi:hypothetical protein
LTHAASVGFTVIFSKPVTGVDVQDFILSATGVTGALIKDVSGSGDTYTVTVSTGSGNGTIRLDLVDDDSIKDTADDPLGGMGAGNGDFTSGEMYDVNKITIILSANTYDGWVLESAETSNVGGTINKTTATLNLGDNAANKQYRSILSFDTSVLLDNAVITSVTLKFKYAGVIGTDPFNTHGSLLADVRKGPFKNIALEIGDLNASKLKVLTYTKATVDNWYARSFNPADFQFINLSGVTQFRLRFSKDDNNDLGADLLRIYSGNAAVEAERPQLVIEYYIP